jgi:hypothetical protein
VLAFAVAVALHALWDSQTSLVGTAVVAVVSLVAFGWTVHRVKTGGAVSNHPFRATALDPPGRRRAPRVAVAPCPTGATASRAV